MELRVFKSFKNMILICFLLFAGVNIANADNGAHVPLTGPNFSNVIEFDTNFTLASVEILIDEIEEEVKAGKKEIIIGLNSPGGSIFAGNKLIHKLLTWQGQGIKFTGVVREYCMSMCFSTLQVLNKRLSYPFAIFLDHPASGGNNRAGLAQIEQLLDFIVDNRLKKAGRSEHFLKLYRLMVLNEFYFNTKSALEFGLIDKVIMPGSEAKKDVPSGKK